MKCDVCGELYVVNHNCKKRLLAEPMRKTQEIAPFLQNLKFAIREQDFEQNPEKHYFRKKLRVLQSSVYNLERIVYVLEKELVSHKLDTIKDRIDDINQLNRKIIRDMSLLTEEEKDEVIRYLAETSKPLTDSIT